MLLISLTRRRARGYQSTGMNENFSTLLYISGVEALVNGSALQIVASTARLNFSSPVNCSTSTACTLPSGVCLTVASRDSPAVVVTGQRQRLTIFLAIDET
jgi:hypothetical protein